MKKHRLSVLAALALAALLAHNGPAASAQSNALHRWPTLQEQLDVEEVPHGSALAKLIQDNQDFTLLRPEEAGDHIRVPLWLRVVWHKAHPEGVYSGNDSTGGYPLVLKEAAEWMYSHPDLKRGVRERDLPPELFKTTIGSNLRISGSATNSRSESDIRINFNSPSKIIAASNNIVASGHQVQYFSTDGGATWGQTTLPFTGSDAFHSDPTVDWTSDGTAWSTTIGINSAGSVLMMRAYKSTNNGATWTFDATFSGTQNQTDKQQIWVDHSATSPFKDNLYVCWHNGLPGFANRRTGPAGSWQTAIQVSGAETTGTSIGCDVTSNAAGDVFIAWPDTGSRGIYLVKSTNGGASYGAASRIATSIGSFDIGVPSFNSRRMLIYSTIGSFSNGTRNDVYMAYNDLSGDAGCTAAGNEPGSNAASTCKSRIWFTRSTNGGTTWSTPVKINNPSNLDDQYNPWLAVDPTNGQISVMYYDTIADSTRKKSDVWYQTSTDFGASWSTALKVTTAQTDETIAGADSGNQYGDYNGMSGFNGSFFPSWTDRRSGAKEEIWTANIQESVVACTPPAAPTGVTASGGTNAATVSWSAVAGATEYHVLRSTTSGSGYVQVGTSTGTTFNDTGLACNTTYFYVVRAANSATCESANSAQASATTAACPVCTTTTLYNHNFDAASGLDGFSTGTFVAGGSTASWRGVQTCTAASGTRIFRYGGTTCTTDYTNNNFTFAQPNGAGGIAIPAGSTTSRLTFKHRRAFESGFDGGTLLVSVNGTNYFFVPATAILAGTAAYNGTIAASCPPAGAAGAAVFTGTQSTFVTTTVDLDAACNLATGLTTGCAGQAVRIAFTSISDCSVTGDGWFLDDVSVQACVP
jgi:hypothetical protein